jgi:hypothetical protein
MMTLIALAAPPSLLPAGDNDQQVANQIAANIKNAGDLKGYEISVKYRDGVALLEGWVRSQQQMEKALAIASRTPQVEEVVNKLEIKSGADAARKTLQPASHQRSGQPQPQGVVGAQPAPFAPAGVQGTMAAYPQPGVFVPAQGIAMPMIARRQANGQPVPEYAPGTGGGTAPALYDQPYMPQHSWPSYAAYPNYAALTYPKQYAATAWPYIGPFYPYPQVPLGWRKVTLEWDDGWWFLDFTDDRRHCCGR